METQSGIKLEVTLETTDVDVIQKAKFYLEHYGNTELSEQLDSIWRKLTKAMLSVPS